MARAAAPDVGSYIAAAPKAARPKLRQMRQAIRSAAPEASERISYGMPYYEFHGRLIYFAAQRSHIGLYVLGGAKTAYAKELRKYLSGESTARFPLDEPLPVTLVRRIVKLRLKENAAAAKRR